ncbi:hypothetical protein D3C79_855070 [compost metagenome]
MRAVGLGVLLTRDERAEQPPLRIERHIAGQLIHARCASSPAVVQQAQALGECQQVLKADPALPEVGFEQLVVGRQDQVGKLLDNLAFQAADIRVGLAQAQPDTGGSVAFQVLDGTPAFR